jgi:glycosyltransferase involved in cell wall biosynthesis
MVPIRNPKALAEAMLRVLNDADLEERLRRNGPPSTASFTWEKVVDRFEHALNSLYDDAAPGGPGDGERSST